MRKYDGSPADVAVPNPNGPLSAKDPALTINICVKNQGNTPTTSCCCPRRSLHINAYENCHFSNPKVLRQDPGAHQLRTSMRPAQDRIPVSFHHLEDSFHYLEGGKRHWASVNARSLTLKWASPSNDNCSAIYDNQNKSTMCFGQVLVMCFGHVLVMCFGHVLVMCFIHVLVMISRLHRSCPKYFHSHNGVFG